jgi:hypothetical protein
MGKRASESSTTSDAIEPAIDIVRVIGGSSR